MFEWQKKDGKVVGVQMIGDKVINHPKMYDNLQQSKVVDQTTRYALGLIYSRVTPLYTKDGKMVYPHKLQFADATGL